jgi:hypothetical protein
VNPSYSSESEVSFFFELVELFFFLLVVLELFFFELREDFLLRDDR